MKGRLDLTALFIGALFSVIPIAASAQTKPADTVRAFYKWYVHELNRDQTEPLKSGKTIARKYVTARLLARIEKQMSSDEGIDADYFLSAQDWDKNWENNIVIGKISTTGTTSIVNAVLPSKMMGDHRLKIVLKKESGLWKIDKVNDWNI